MGRSPCLTLGGGIRAISAKASLTAVPSDLIRLRFQPEIAAKPPLFLGLLPEDLNDRRGRGVATLVMAAATSGDWCGYWRRAQKAA
jgi:hypothetical protein